MLHGINKRWKQPIFYRFVNGAAPAAEIMNAIKVIVRETRKAGLQIMATICDQGTNNVSAISSLIADTRAHYIRNGKELVESTFEIDEQQIVPLFDVPHLMKGVRNNFLKYNVKFVMNNKLMTAKWEHIYKAWQMDTSLGSLRLMPKLTGYHVDPAYIKKMKVSCCTQALSRSVAVGINVLAKTGMHKYFLISNHL